MFYCIPTKKGLGVEIWGTRDDLEILYDTISKFWNDETFFNFKGYEDKNNLISAFLYEVRKATSGSRSTRESSHFSFDEIPHFGFKVSWPHILFSVAALRYNMKMVETTKWDVAIFLLLEYELERSLENYDLEGAKKLITYLNGAINADNEYLYLFMRNVNASFFQLKGGKRAFRKLADLMRVSLFFSEEYNELLHFLESEANKYNCNIKDLELNDNDALYEIEW